jgi:hypothetical protein
LIFVTKVSNMWTYQNEHNMLLNFPRCLSILLLQISKTGNNALDTDAIYNLKCRNNVNQNFSNGKGKNFGYWSLVVHPDASIPNQYSSRKYRFY